MANSPISLASVVRLRAGRNAEFHCVVGILGDRATTRCGLSFRLVDLHEDEHGAPSCKTCSAPISTQPITRSETMAVWPDAEDLEAS